MNAKIYILLLVALASCEKSKTMENVLQTQENEYWIKYDQYSSSFTYYKFAPDKMSHQYERNNKYEFQENLGSGSEKWSVSNDSILKWGLAFDIVSYNDKVIVLSYEIEKSPEYKYIFLVKANKNDLRKYSGDFEQKRKKNPEKYKMLNWWKK